ncbi:hypothetical protein WQ54_04130 [Bacillus sp. SA1-12]|uniref:DinB family protein n=1 Tax=Bacillus sp. SA1-12 TaxID=1455638 RepID=UPI000625F8E7|nr:DinB family protein [Bacillus sp. SA1-12]KKI93434.1 hypothetical protein WQ54_04130 [Bacillus sp. SA1-12]
MATLSLIESIQSIHSSLDRIIQKANELTEDVIRWKPSDEEWSIMQILCHLVEAVPYWLNEIELLLESPGKEWGRGLQNVDRLAAVISTKVDGTPLSSVIKELEELKPQVEMTLKKLDDETLWLEAPSRNPRFGTKPISFIVDHLLVEHVAKHFGQMKRNLTKVNQD